MKILQKKVTISADDWYRITIEEIFSNGKKAEEFVTYVRNFDADEKVELTKGVTVNLTKKTLTVEGRFTITEFEIAEIDAIFKGGQEAYVLCGRDYHSVKLESLLNYTEELMKKLAEHCEGLEQIGGIYVKPDCVEGVSVAPFHNYHDYYDVYLTVNGVLLPAVDRVTFGDAKRECDRLRNKFGVK